MLKTLSRTRVVGLWFVAVAVIIGGLVATGVNIAVSTAALLLTMCLVPPAIVWLVWPGAPSPTVGDMLHSGNRQKEG